MHDKIDKMVAAFGAEGQETKAPHIINAHRLQCSLMTNTLYFDYVSLYIAGLCYKLLIIIIIRPREHNTIADGMAQVKHNSCYAI